MLAGAAPALLSLFINFFVPESKRWQAAVEKEKSHPYREVFSPRLLKTTLLAISFASVALIGTWGSVQWIPTWVNKMTAGTTIPHPAATTQVVEAIGAIVGCFMGSLLCVRFGRRWTYFGLCASSWLICTILFTRFSSYDTGWFLLVAALASAATAAFYGWLPLYLPELFPTRIRATGQGICFNFGRILAAAGAIYQGNLVKAYEGSYAKAGATIVLVYFAGMVLIWFAPETKGKPLPE